MPDLIWAPFARLDLDDIHHFLLERDGAAGARILRAIRSSADRLALHPWLGRPLRTDLRVMGVPGTPYLLVYRTDGRLIEIARVRHRRENWANQP